MNWPRFPLARVARAAPADRDFLPDENVWHLTLDQIEGGTGRIVGKQVAPASAAGSSTYVFDSGNVLYSKLRPYLNKVVKPAEAGIATTELVPMRPDPDILCPEFLAHYLRSPSFVAFASGCVAGVKMPRIIMAKFWEHEVPLPPLSEQRRIVEILDQADCLRHLRAQADSKAERFPDALFRQMFANAASGAERLTSVPLGEVTREFRYGTSTMCLPEPSGLPVLRIPNIVGGELALSDLKYASLPLEEVQRLRLEVGDILCVRTNGNPDYVGRCAVFDLKESYLFASYLIRARLDMSKADPWYVGSFMRSRDGRLAMSPYIRTTAGQSNISVGGLSQIPVPLPPIAEQQRFRVRSAAAHGVLRDMKHAAGLLSRTFESLLRRAFTGDLSAPWRQAHMKELVEEMEQQAKTLAELR